MIIISDNLLLPKNDLVFQKLFGKQKNSKITQHLLSLILEREIINIQLDVNKRVSRNKADSKVCKLDVRATYNDGEDCDIEIQVNPFPSIEKRLLSYWAMMYSEKCIRGKTYSIIKPSVCILIADYKLDELKHISQYHTVWNLRERTFNNQILSSDIEIHILEIPKIKNNDILKDELASWLKFMDDPKNEEVKMMMRESPLYKQAEEELAYLSGDPDFRQKVEDYVLFMLDQNTIKEHAEKCGFEEGNKRGLAEGTKRGLAEGTKRGLREGRKEGRKESRIEIAQKLLNLAMPIEQVMQITELTKEDIEKLLKTV